MRKPKVQYRKLRVLVSCTRRGVSPESFELEGYVPEGEALSKYRSIQAALYAELKRLGFMGGAQ